MLRWSVPATPGASCTACGASADHWNSKEGFLLLRCGTCGTIVARPESGGPLEPAHYASYHQCSTYEVPEVVEASLDSLAASAEPYRRTGRWLDIGYGEGGLLSAAQRRGWACYGTEQSSDALAFGRSRGWTVTEQASGDDRFGVEDFDIVTLVEVIEHLADPIRALSQAVRWLRPGGLLYLTTPNANSLNRLLLGQQWSIFCPPEHLTIWTRVGLVEALGGVGMTRIRLRTQGLNPAEILARFRPPGRQRVVHRQAAALSLNQALSRTRPRRALKRAANAALNLFGIGDTLKAWSEKPW